MFLIWSVSVCFILRTLRSIIFWQTLRWPKNVINKLQLHTSKLFDYRVQLRTVLELSASSIILKSKCIVDKFCDVDRNDDRFLIRIQLISSVGNETGNMPEEQYEEDQHLNAFVYYRGRYMCILEQSIIILLNTENFNAIVHESTLTWRYGLRYLFFKTENLK